MKGVSTERTADQLINQYGIYAKREATRKLLFALSEYDTLGEVFWRSVIDQIIDEESRNPKIYDYLLDREFGPGDVLVGELHHIATQTHVPSGNEWAVLQQTCGRAATYIGELERALSSLVYGEDGSRMSAIQVLVAGPLHG